jgi:hypothetical protein
MGSETTVYDYKEPKRPPFDKVEEEASARGRWGWERVVKEMQGPKAASMHPALAELYDLAFHRGPTLDEWSNQTLMGIPFRDLLRQLLAEETPAP